MSNQLRITASFLSMIAASDMTKNELAIDGLAKREIHFIYFPSAMLQHPDGEGQRLVLNSSNGLDVKRITDLSWNVSDFGKTVRFNLNDLSKVRSSKDFMRKQETFTSPVFDESGLRSFLLFDKQKHTFFRSWMKKSLAIC